MYPYADLCLIAQSFLQMPGIPVDEDYYMAVCRNVGIYLLANLVWLYITLREYSTEQFRLPRCPQNILY